MRKSNFRMFTERLVFLALLGMISGSGFTASQAETSVAQAATKPNILFVLTDDMNTSDLRHMPQTRKLLADRGVTFTNAFVTNSLCCPSRATIVRGQYSHNHQILDNVAPLGGFEKFRDLGLDDSTIATWLDDPNNFADGVDYDTVLIGKYLNEYDDTTYVPPGWDRWFGWLGIYDSPGGEYRLNENGKIENYNLDQIHDTDLFANKAATFMRKTAGAHRSSYTFPPTRLTPPPTSRGATRTCSRTHRCQNRPLLTNPTSQTSLGRYARSPG